MIHINLREENYLQSNYPISKGSHIVLPEGSWILPIFGYHGRPQYPIPELEYPIFSQIFNEAVFKPHGIPM